MTISAGWYPDPAEPSVQRYWDGEGWVGASIPVDATPPDGPPPAEATRATKPMSYDVNSSTPAAGSTGGSAPAQSTPDAPAAQPGAQWPGPYSPGRQLPGQPGNGQPSYGQPSYGQPSYGQPIPGPYAPPMPVRPLGLPLATPGARLLARMIDTAVVLLLNVLVNGWFVYLLYLDLVPLYREVLRLQQESGQLFPDVGQLPQSNSNGLILVIIVLAAALWFAYEVPATANSGQTLGKRLLRIKVVPVEGDKPLGFGRSWGRWSMMGLPVLFIPCCAPLFVILLPVLWFIDALPIAVDSFRRMAIHDRRAQTYVVQLAPERKPS